MYVSVDSSDSPTHTPATDLPERWQERFANLSPSKKNNQGHPTPKSCDHSEWPGNFYIPELYLKMWRRQNTTFKTTAKHSKSTGSFVCVRSWGMTWVWVFFLLVFFVVMSQWHKHGALPGRIGVSQAQATLFKKKKSPKPENGYSHCLRVKAGNEHSYPRHINCIFFLYNSDFPQYLCFYILWLT